MKTTFYDIVRYNLKKYRDKNSIDDSTYENFIKSYTGKRVIRSLKEHIYFLAKGGGTVLLINTMDVHSVRPRKYDRLSNIAYVYIMQYFEKLGFKVKHKDESPNIISISWD